MSNNSAIQQIVCCMGQPVEGNPTQFMMEKAFAAADLDWRYLTLEVPSENLAASVAGMKAMGFRGGNFTIPHKVAVIELLDELSQAAELMGAVNCVNIVEGKMIGENTDGKGFVASLREIVDPKEKRAVIIGAGGAARAISVELALSGTSHITIVNRGEQRGTELTTLLNERANVASEFVLLEDEYTIAEEADILINATSIGLGDADARVPIDEDSLRSELVVADVIFNPPNTKFLKAAAAKFCQTLDGLGMLVNQAVIGFQIWTGVEPSAAVMREALEEYLEI